MNPTITFPNGDRYEIVDFRKAKIGESFLGAVLSGGCGVFITSSLEQRPILKKLEPLSGDGDVEALLAAARDARHLIGLVSPSDVASAGFSREDVYRIHDNLKAAVATFPDPKPERFTVENNCVVDNKTGEVHGSANTLAALLNNLSKETSPRRTPMPEQKLEVVTLHFKERAMSGARMWVCGNQLEEDGMRVRVVRASALVEVLEARATELRETPHGDTCANNFAADEIESLVATLKEES